MVLDEGTMTFAPLAFQIIFAAIALVSRTAQCVAGTSA